MPCRLFTPGSGTHRKGNNVSSYGTADLASIFTEYVENMSDLDELLCGNDEEVEAVTKLCAEEKNTQEVVLGL